jgi:DNA repair exonuclease SbcCD ATPase subunit
MASYKGVEYSQDSYATCELVIAKAQELEKKCVSLCDTRTNLENQKAQTQLALAGLVAYDKPLSELDAECDSVTQAIADAVKREEAYQVTLQMLATLNMELEQLDREIAETEQNTEKNTQREKYVGVLNSVYDILHTTKFPRLLINTYAGTVTEYMEEVLDSFNFPYKAKVNETFGVDVFNDEGLQLPSVSGGQQVMIGLGLRLALHNMFVGAFPFMIIDEGSYGLNAENTKKYFEILSKLGKSSKFKQVIVIDHHPELSEYVDNTINL